MSAILSNRLHRTLKPDCDYTDPPQDKDVSQLFGNATSWQLHTDVANIQTPPPLLPLPPLFSTLNEISPICGGNSVAHPSQNMSDVIPLTSPGSSPSLLPPPHTSGPCPPLRRTKRGADRGDAPGNE